MRIITNKNELEYYTTDHPMCNMVEKYCKLKNMTREDFNKLSKNEDIMLEYHEAMEIGLVSET
jgi:hypothetical protein